VASGNWVRFFITEANFLQDWDDQSRFANKEGDGLWRLDVESSRVRGGQVIY